MARRATLLAKRILALRERVVATFDSSDWEEIGLLTGESSRIDRHPRLLRSLAWGDEDYAGNALNVIKAIAETNPEGFTTFEEFVNQKYPGESVYVSAKPSERKITFAPNVFQVPERTGIEADLVALMMPFSPSFDAVHRSVQGACDSVELRCLRVDDIWEDSVIVQDIFRLIFRARIVVVDFTTRNANVMYETGIAHTLGKHVIPMAQTLQDVPFDMQHHRVLQYLANQQGLAEMEVKLAKKLEHVSE